MEAGGRSWRLPRRRAAGSSPGKAARASRGWRCFSEISALHSGYASPSIPGSSKNTKHAIGNTSLGCLTLAAESLCVVCHLDCIDSHKIYRAASPIGRNPVTPSHCLQHSGHAEDKNPSRDTEPAFFLITDSYKEDKCVPLRTCGNKKIKKHQL